MAFILGTRIYGRGLVEQMYHGAKVKLLIDGKVEEAGINCTGNLLGIIGQLKNLAAIPYHNEGFSLLEEFEKRNIRLLEIKSGNDLPRLHID